MTAKGTGSFGGAEPVPTESLLAGDADGTDDDRRDEALVVAAREGDERSFELLLTRHEGRVLRVLRLLGIDENDREDVAQEVFVRVFRHLDRGLDDQFALGKATGGEDHRARGGLPRQCKKFSAIELHVVSDLPRKACALWPSSGRPRSLSVRRCRGGS